MEEHFPRDSGHSGPQMAFPVYFYSEPLDHFACLSCPVPVSEMQRLCKITDSLFISNARSACNCEFLCKEGITLCINVSKQQPFPHLELSTIRVPVHDQPTEKLYEHFDCCADAIEGAVTSRGRAVVYCKNGRSRSATICVAYLMKHRGLGLQDAFQMVKNARSVVEPNEGFWAQLQRYEEELRERMAPKEKQIHELTNENSVLLLETSINGMST